MKWERLGLVFCADNHAPWMRTHAANPVAEMMDGDLCRVYFNCRDERNRSSVGVLVIDLNRPQEILELSSNPVLAPGERGLFDDAGVSLGNVVKDGCQRRLYYTGWTLGVSVPWVNAIGLASLDGGESCVGTFERVSRAPVLGRSEVDPFSVSYPWVCRDGGRWRMWYGSNLAATAMDRRQIPHVIRHAESVDGVSWEVSNRVCVGGALSGVCAFTRPSVLHSGSTFRMWYSCRDTEYVIGYAESGDGLEWTILDDVGGLMPNGDSWESDATAYPCVLEHAGCEFLFYNGNDYGRTGFGLAVSV